MIKNLIANVLLTLVLAIIVTWLGLYGWCTYSPFSVMCRGSNTYALSAVLAAAGVLGSYFIAQHSKTLNYFKKKKRALPLPIAKAAQTFQRTVQFILDADEIVETSEQLASKGWVVEYESGHTVVVHERDFYYWLLRVVRLQQELEKSEEINVRSPLSQRGSGLKRSTWQIYRMFLLETFAVKQLNGNVLVLKDEVCLDPYRVIRKLNELREVIEI